KIAEGMKKTAPDGAVSGMPAIRETGPGKNLQAITVSTDAATNVALQMYMNDGTTTITPDTETGNILLQNGDQTLTFKVDYIATGKATSGNVNAVTNFHINYY
ncbi:hypothetical protein Q5490_12170, partial [Escherichia coli]|nr:hypothetical protein [Escherichia coli]